MITNFLINMMAGIVDGLFSLIPAWTLDTSVVDSALALGVTAGSLDGWLPETFVFGCLALIVGVRLFFLAFNGIQWLYHLIPFNGGS